MSHGADLCSTNRSDGKENQPIGIDVDDENRRSPEKRSKLSLTEYDDAKSLFSALRTASKDSSILFNGSFKMGTDQAIDDKDRNKNIAEDIWAATGYRWSVHDHTLLADGLSSRFYCCQDEERKKESEKSTRPGAVHWETEGMDHFPCQSKLTVTVTCRGQPAGHQSISLRIEHHKPHNIWAVPSALATMVREDFSHVSSQQVYRACVSFSEGLWKCAEDQIDSATALLKEMHDEADILKVETVEGVTALGWDLERISQHLQGKIVEIAIDATFRSICFV
ncbi:hypothetical protein M422DRAFT_276328 [Sphaerobolus stellatus SS14]|uniref:Uncharacterized protein n=1 Tax=Sphaerobolus stellatus (strain SS14) TaxID=990650 RepID=A0A0C9U254_SPHS4|nr:hypothetical protein M422DRAFT_276328 [Sphaerobolus stellatus SS14]